MVQKMIGIKQKPYIGFGFVVLGIEHWANILQHRNHTLNFEFWSFSQIVNTWYEYCLMMLGSNCKPQFPVGHTIMGINNLTLQCTGWLNCDVQWIRHIECIFNLLYLKFMMGLSECNPIRSPEVSVVCLWENKRD